MKAKREAALHTLDTERLWWLGRCPRCGVVMKAVEVGEMDYYSRSEMVRLGYRVSQGPVKGMPDFRQPHSKECK